MDKAPRVVYLEDLEKPAPASATKENLSVVVAEDTLTKHTMEATATETKATEKKTDTGATKRQRSIAEMFSSSSSTSSPATKKAKTNATPTLNSIPFSMSEFQSSLSDEEKRLLALECETMGKSW